MLKESSSGSAFVAVSMSRFEQICGIREPGAQGSGSARVWATESIGISGRAKERPQASANEYRQLWEGHRMYGDRERPRPTRRPLERARGIGVVLVCVALTAPANEASASPPFV